MSNTGIDPTIIDMVKDFLIAKSQRSMTECLGIQIPKYVRLAKVCDRIRYDGLVEGRIAKNVVGNSPAYAERVRTTDVTPAIGTQLCGKAA